MVTIKQFATQMENYVISNIPTDNRLKEKKNYSILVQNIPNLVIHYPGYKILGDYVARINNRDVSDANVVFAI